ncbi:PF20097 family protein [Bremerella sp. P1]|uniref:PF20097 family protein n=1 Tax=Bremerella sp. P1 TaxID=3026424 RepID=UPI00236781EC|nr:PF20097 family protein [Bremerella sp. P1]WDI42811.1 PF20097 family protein [Bremerella sp. P1]
MSANPYESPVEATLAEESTSTENTRTCPDCGNTMVRGLVRNTHINWDDNTRSWLRKFFFGCQNLTPIYFIQIGTHKIPGYYCQACQILTMDLDPKKR